MFSQHVPGHCPVGSSGKPTQAGTMGFNESYEGIYLFTYLFNVTPLVILWWATVLESEKKTQ